MPNLVERLILIREKKAYHFIRTGIIPESDGVITKFCTIL